MKNFAIVLIGYNRPNSIERILNKLNECDYKNDNVTLIISLDNPGNFECKVVADNYNWEHGPKKVIFHKEKMGLKAHVLSCGDLLLNDDYDALIVLEDDVFPSVNFYNYAKAAYDAYSTDEKIAGFSLYSPSFMNTTDYVFNPIKDGSDVYFMKVAQSWGQVWTKEQWKTFRNWYNDKWENSEALPSIIRKWGSQSWLKYYMKYCAEENKYFVYPYDSLTTCFSQKGIHTAKTTTKLQKSLVSGIKNDFNMRPLTEKSIRYDSFYENENLINYLASKYNIDNSAITVDLYGTKKFYNQYLVSLENKNYKIIDTFDLNLKPHELNITENIQGDKIKIYDTNVIVKNKFSPDSRTNLIQKLSYYNEVKFQLSVGIKIFFEVCIDSIQRFINHEL